MVPTKSKYKVLHFCNKMPYPPKDGGAIGINNVTKGLIDLEYDVRVLAINSTKHYIDTANLPTEYLNLTKFESVEVDLDIKIFPALSNLILSRRSYNISRFYNVKLLKKLKGLLNDDEFDIVILESIFLVDYLPIIRKKTKAKIILRAPNVEFIIWKRLSEIEANPFKKFYLKVLTSRLRREEIRCLNKFDAIITVSDNDKKLLKTFGATVPIESIPTGIDVEKDMNTTSVDVEYPSLFHLGALDWYPNQEAVSWILKNVWPELKNRLPNIKFYIAGRRPPEWINNIEEEDVVVLGEVEDAAEFIKSKAIMPVPIFAGSGMRVKIIEAMMLKKAVVSTSIGIEGIDHNDKEDILIANNPKDFIDSIEKLATDKDYYNSVCENAYINIMKKYGKDVLDDLLDKFIKEILKS